MALDVAVEERSTRARPGVVAGSLLAGLLATVLLGSCGGTPPESTDLAEPVVAVLPFDVERQDEGAEFVGRAFAESLAINLSQAEGLRILAVPETAEAARDATHRISGTLTRDGRSVEVHLQLRVGSESIPSWETRPRSGGGDLPELSARLARQTLDALGIARPDLYDHVTHLAVPRGASEGEPAASGWASWRSGDIDAFLRVASNLVDRYGEDAAAHALSAWALTLAWDAVPSNETLTRLKERLAALERVDPPNPYDQLLRAYVYRSSGEPDQARILYSQVLARMDLSPSARAWALRQRCYTDLQLGDVGAALRDADEAVRLDPTDASARTALSKALETSGRLDEAISRSLEAIRLEPLGWRHHQRLGLVYSRAEKLELAVASLEHACDFGESQEACANLAVALLQHGQAGNALTAARHAESLAATRWGFYNLACYWALAGDRNEAMECLDRSLRLGFADALIDSDPDLDSLRAEPGFEAIATEVANRLRSRRQFLMSVFPWQAGLVYTRPYARA